MLNLIRNTVSNFRLTKAKQDANNFLAAAGITGQVQSQAIYNLVNDLQASGLWSKMKAVYPMVTDNRNIFSYTEDFTNAAWQKSGISAAGDTTTAPNGTLTADTIQNGSTSGYMRQVNLILSSGQYTQSAYFKKNNNDWVAVYTSDGGPNYAIAYFNINTGVVGTVSANGTFSAASSSIQNVGGGWYRCSLTFTKPTTASTDVATNIPDADNTFSRTIGQNAFIWGAQVESGTLSTYQPILTTPAAFMASQMKYNLKDARDLDAAFRLTWSGGWTYSATGATPNGTNAYADTKLVPSSVLNNANDGHLSYYSRTQSTGNYVDIGTQNGASSFDLLISYAGTLAGACINMLDSNLFSYTGATTGLFIGSQNNTPNIRKFFRNNILTQTQTVSQNEQPTTAISIGARGPANNNFYTNRQCAFASIGNGLSDNDALLFNQIVEKYQVALSRGVQAAQSFYYNSAYSNEANTYLYSTQITGTTQVSAINTLINGLKANNLWAKMKAVYPFVTDKTLQADMAAQMKFNLVNPQDSDAAFRLAFSGGWTYSTNGAQPNGTNGYADTKLIPNTILSLNSVSFSAYSRNNFTPTIDQSLGCGSGASNLPLLGQSFTSLKDVYSFIYSYSVPDVMISSPNQNLAAMFLSTRTAANNAKSFRNTTQLASVTTQAQTTQPTNNFFFGAFNGALGIINYSSFQYAFAHIGTGLSDAEAALLYQLIQEYQTTLSRQV
jgi:hypothetical protein